MPRKRAPRADDNDQGAAEYFAGKGSPAAGAKLRCSEIPGVWLNEFNIPCDEDGVAMSFKQVKARDATRLEEAYSLEGDQAVDTPAKFLKAVAMDPRVPMSARVSAAVSAAPYFDRKQPIAIDGGAGDNGKPVPLFDFNKLQGLSTAELSLMRDLLTKAGGKL